MPLRPLAYREVKRKLESAGFAEGVQKGSHVKFFKHYDSDTRTAIVPRHREVSIGTPSSILRQAGLTVEEFEVL